MPDNPLTSFLLLINHHPQRFSPNVSRSDISSFFILIKSTPSATHHDNRCDASVPVHDIRAEQCCSPSPRQSVPPFRVRVLILFPIISHIGPCARTNLVKFRLKNCSYRKCRSLPTFLSYYFSLALNLSPIESLQQYYTLRRHRFLPFSPPLIHPYCFSFHSRLSAFNRRWLL